MHLPELAAAIVAASAALGMVSDASHRCPSARSVSDFASACGLPAFARLRRKPNVPPLT